MPENNLRLSGYLIYKMDVDSRIVIVKVATSITESWCLWMVSKKKREKLIVQLLREHEKLSLNQIHQELPENTKKQIYNALKSLFEKDQITTKVQRINDEPTTMYQLTNSPNKP